MRHRGAAVGLLCSALLVQRRRRVAPVAALLRHHVHAAHASRLRHHRLLLLQQQRRARARERRATGRRLLRLRHQVLRRADGHLQALPALQRALRLGEHPLAARARRVRLRVVEVPLALRVALGARLGLDVGAGHLGHQPEGEVHHRARPLHPA
jgi:hypothetical protein